MDTFLAPDMTGPTSTSVHDEWAPLRSKGLLPEHSDVRRALQYSKWVQRPKKTKMQKQYRMERGMGLAEETSVQHGYGQFEIQGGMRMVVGP